MITIRLEIKIPEGKYCNSGPIGCSAIYDENRCMVFDKNLKMVKFRCWGKCRKCLSVKYDNILVIKG